MEGSGEQARCYKPNCHLHHTYIAANQAFQNHRVKRCTKVHTWPLIGDFWSHGSWHRQPCGKAADAKSSPPACHSPVSARAPVSRVLRALTLTVLLIGPVPAVILLIALPPVGDAVPIATLELVVPGAVRGLCWVF